MLFGRFCNFRLFDNFFDRQFLIRLYDAVMTQMLITFIENKSDVCSLMFGTVDIDFSSMKLYQFPYQH